MNFDRKPGNSNGKVAEGASAFPEIPRVFDDRAQNDFSNHHSADGHRDFAADAYPSGAFPALDVAYPNQSGGNFVTGGHAAANGQPAGFQAYAGAAEGNERAYADYERFERPSYPPATAAASPQRSYRPQSDFRSAEEEQFAGSSGFYAADGYRGGGFSLSAEQRGYSGGYDDYGQIGGESAGSAQNMAQNAERGRHGGADEAAAQPGGSALQDMAFAEQAGRADLGGAALQPAGFDASDYDYGYNPQDLAPAEPYFSGSRGQQNSAAAAESRAYPPQVPERGYAGAPDYAENVAAAPAAEQNIGGGYTLSAGYYNAAGNQPYRMENFAPDNRRDFSEQAAAAPHYQEQEMPAPAGGFAAGGNDYPAATGEPFYAVADEAPLPFLDDEEENADLAADFARIDGDVSAIDRMADFEVADNFSPSGHGALPRQPVSQEWGDGGLPAGSQGNQPINDGNEAFFAESEMPQSSQRQPDSRQSAAAAIAGQEQDFAADMAYDDNIYDWGAPAAAVSAGQQHPYAQENRSRKILFLAIVLAMLTFAGVGLYWLFGRQQAVYDGAPVIIHKAAGNYKIKPSNAVKSAADNQEQSVSEGVSGDNAVQARQKTLIDNSEAPIEMQKSEERLPFSNEGRFDQSSVESLIKSAVAQATPVHIVPNVRVDADRKIVTAADNETETVLIPGGSGGFSFTPPAAEPAEQSGYPQPDKPRIMRSKVEKPAADRRSTAAPPMQSAFAAVPPVMEAEEAAAASKPARIAIASAAARPAGDFYMQISSQPTREAAEQSLRAAKQYLSAAGADKIIIVPATIPNKGTYYRVRIPAQSREEAARLCEDYKQSGGHCFIAR